MRLSLSSHYSREEEAGRRVIEQANVGTLADFDATFEVGDVIGRGASSVVRVVRRRDTGALFACKFVDKYAIAQQKDRLQAEIKVLMKVRHENIVSLHALYETDRDLRLIVDYVPGGELFDRILSKRVYSEREAAEVIAQLLSAVEFLHRRNIVHRDIKPENVLLASVDDDTKIKLSDFGLAKIFEDPAPGAGGGGVGAFSSGAGGAPPGYPYPNLAFSLSGSPLAPFATASLSPPMMGVTLGAGGDEVAMALGPPAAAATAATTTTTQPRVSGSGSIDVAMGDAFVGGAAAAALSPSWGSASGSPKLGQGLPRQRAYTTLGTDYYIAPEILKGEGYDKQVDMWSVGVVAYILLCGFPPFADPNGDVSRIYARIRVGQFDFPSPYWDTVSEQAKDLIRRLLTPDPERRINASAALLHPWIKAVQTPGISAFDNPLSPHHTMMLRKFHKKQG